VRTPLTDQNDFPMPMIMEPDKAARIIVNGMERRRAHIHFPWVFSTLLRLSRCCRPRGYIRLMRGAVRG
jgi:hypothetical protein